MATLPWRALAPTGTPTTPGVLLRALAAGGDAPLEALRRWIRTEFDATDVQLCDSGTSALRLTLEALAGKGPVALPAFGCFDLATAARGARVPVAFYDLDPNTLTPDLTDLEDRLRGGVSVLVVASLYGYAPPMAELRRLCDAYGVHLVEDIAQGTGASWEGIPLGRWGDAAVLSFGRGKGVGGAGGGACLFRRPLHAHPSIPAAAPPTRGIRRVLALAVQQGLSHPAVFALPQAMPFLRLGETRYLPPWIPTGITPAQAVVALDGACRQHHDHGQRVSVATVVEDAIGVATASGSGCIASLPGGQAGYLRLGVIRSVETPLPARLPSPLFRRGVRSAYPQVLPDLPVFRAEGPSGKRLPAFAGARSIVRRVATMPTHRHVTADDLMHMVEAWRRLT
jgi:hypothetical protein